MSRIFGNQTEQDIFDQIIKQINDRLDLIEKVFIKIMQHDVRLHTLEFNSNVPVQPSAAEKLLELHLRLERLESINGVTHDRTDTTDE